jgi:hypothetical protein
VLFRSKTVKKSAGHWAMGLLTSMKDPELIIKEDDTVVIIKDKFPKVTQIQPYQGLQGID